MKILVTGQNGQVAQAILAFVAQNYAKHDMTAIALGRPELDLADKASVEIAIAHYKPDIIVNAAAYTAVDKAEDEVALAFQINRDGAKNVAEMAANFNIPIIHISTDYVFNGLQPQPYKEDDAPGALSVYGLSKLQGEWAVAAANPNHVILRTAWVYSHYGHNFLNTMLQLAKTRNELNVVCDQFGTPTHAYFLAKNIIKISQQILSASPPSNWHGVFHLVPDGKTNWADFARAIFSLYEKQLGKKMIVHNIAARDYKTKAIRPYFSVLNNQKFYDVFKLTREDWQDLLKKSCNGQNLL